MPRLIDADELIKVLDDTLAEQSKDADIRELLQKSLLVGFAKQVIEDAPTVDAEPVRHGHWCVTQAYPHTVYCSECFKRFAQAHWAVWEDGSLPRDYCPNCGAKMDERINYESNEMEKSYHDAERDD